MFDDKIVSLCHEDILAEYDEVLPQPTDEILIDMDDLIFYEADMEKRDDDAYLVTGSR